MDQKWILILVMLVSCQKLISGTDKVVQEGASVEINCKPPEMGSFVVWLRVRDNSNVDFIASSNNAGRWKTKIENLSDKKIESNTLTLNSFTKARDSGIYTCASVKNNELKFGKITRLVADKVIHTSTVPATQTATTRPNLPCVCNNVSTSPDLHCTPIILGPLAGACGLLLLLIIITTLYCNKIRTRRCPHHYKRKPRTMDPGKQMMANRHV